MIHFFSEQTAFNFKEKQKTKKWLADVAKNEGKKIGDINFIFCSDEYLLDINKKYLGHDYFTDVITFDDCVGDILAGDIYISVDTVKANAEEFKQTFERELFRVIVHGILHLCTYNDSTEAETAVIHSKEDSYLQKLSI